MTALEKERTEMATIVFEQRKGKALTSLVPRNSTLIIEPGDKVCVYRETEKKYVRPSSVIRIDGTQGYVLQDDRELQFNIHQAILVTTYDRIVHCEKFAETLHSVLSRFKSTQMRSKSSRRQLDPKIMITEVLHHSDPRTRTPEVEAARGREI